MIESEISKKELLELTGITYGQLYRWKRKGLIPEDWFIKKSSYTGQETYFPRDKVLERIDKILHMKDDFSLDQLADTFSTAPMTVAVSMTELVEKGIVSQRVLELYKTMFAEPLIFSDILGLIICEEQLAEGLVSLEEGSELIKFLKQEMPQLPEKAYTLRYMRKLGIGFWVLAETGYPVIFDTTAKQVLSLSIQKYMEKIKTLL